MTAKELLHRARELYDKMGTLTPRKVVTLPGISWRMHPETWAELTADLRVKANYLVNHKENRLLDIPVKLDLGCHRGDLSLVLCVEDRVTGGLINAPDCGMVATP
jgi:hypothetical protein